MTVLTATRSSSKAYRLARHPLLARCAPADLARAASVFDEVTIQAGDVVVAAGPLARWFFLIEEGVAEVDRNVDLGPGDYCGEAALALYLPQAVTVRARTDLRVFAASGRDVVGLARQSPGLRVALPIPVRPPRPLPPLTTRRRPRARASVRPSARSCPSPARTTPHRSRRGWLVAAGLVAGVLAGAALYHPPVILVSPGAAVDITNDVSIAGMPVDAPRGRYLMTTVQYSRPSLLALGLSQFRARHEALALPPAGERAAIRRRERGRFETSRRDAAAAAARAVGIDGPLQVDFRRRDIVGPSGGLAYALLIADLLTPGDLSRGRVLAATGTIDPNGRVGLVAGVVDKAAAARRAGSALLLLPIEQLAGAGGLDLPVVGVSSLADALEALRS